MRKRKIRRRRKRRRRKRRRRKRRRRRRGRRRRKITGRKGKQMKEVIWALSSTSKIRLIYMKIPGEESG